MSSSPIIAAEPSSPRLTPDEIRGLAADYIAPEVAEALLRRACDATAPELQRRAIQALRWLDPAEENPPLPFAHGTVGDALGRAILALVHGLVYHSDRRTRERCAQLVTAIFDEAAKLDASVARRCK